MSMSLLQQILRAFEDQEYSLVHDMYFDTKSRPENQAMTGTELLK